MEEDEDTVLENSPLDKYLQDVSDLEFTKYKSFDETLDREETFDNEPDGNPDFLPNSNDNIGASIFCQNEFVSNSDIIKAVTVLFECVALNDRDKYILHKIEEYNRQQLNNILLEKTTKLQALKLFLSNNIYYFIAFLIAVIALPMPWLFFFSHYEELFVLALLVVGGLIYIVLSPKQSDLSTALLKELVGLSESTEILEMLIKKTLNHIREVDIVMNGYVNTSIHKSFLQKQNANNTKCVRIRKLLYDKLFEGFLVIRSRERIVIQNTSFREIDVSKDEYLAEMPLNVITDLLKHQIETDKNKTNELHIDTVKEMIHLFREQCSEFIYSSILCLHSMDNLEIRELKCIVFGVADINKTLANISKDIENMLESSVDTLFSNHIPATSKSLETLSSTQHDYIHSAKLNLHSALYRLNEIAESSLSEDDQSDGFISSVNQFNLLLENAKTCINEIVAMKKRNEVKNENETESQEEALENKTESESVVETITEPPVEIGDRLIEGQSDSHQEPENNPINSTDDVKKDTENSRKLMRELKCILSVKESPIGLVSFPLDQSTVNKIDKDVIENEDVPTPKQTMKSSYNASEYYGESIAYNNGDKDSDDTYDNRDKSIQFSLPKNFLASLKKFSNNDNVEEEVFGESANGDDEVENDDVMDQNDDIIDQDDGNDSNDNIIIDDK